MVWILLAVAILFFTSTLLVVKTFKKNQQVQEDIEYLKLRVGLVNQYQANVNRHKTCHWCALGAFMGPKNEKEINANRQFLMNAGFREEHHLGAYFFIKYALVLGSLLVMLMLWSWFQISPVAAILVPLAFLLLPERILIFWGNHRLNKVNIALPDFLDMANICMSAGLSYLEAIKRVSKELESTFPEICYEFNFLIEQIKIGVPRQEALKQFALRNPSKDIQDLVQMLIQNEKLGSPISTALNDFSRRMYQKRESAMEEKAAKTSAKMAIVILPFLMLPYFMLMLGEKIVMLGRNF